MKRKPWKSVYRNALQLVLVGAVTGVVVGLVVTIYNLLFTYSEDFARGSYAAVRSNPLWIPVWVLALALGAFLVCSAIQASKIIKGCGIPETEGATRGILRLHWWRDATLMFAVTLLEVFMGLSIGAEGSSVLIGGAIGDGVSSGLKRNFMVRRYQVTGGACAGLAVASNAPLTGMAFAFEEAHKRFTPEVFICAFSSVIFAMLTRTLLYAAFQMPVVNAFDTFSFKEVVLPLKDYPFVLLAGIVCGVLGVLFYKGVFAVRKLFRKISVKNSFWRDFIKVSIAILLGGCIALIAVDALGGGHHLIQSLGSGADHGVTSLFGMPLVWTLIVVALLKGIATCLNVGAGVPCGIFIPIIAIGACIGGVLNQAWLAMGMDKAFCDLMIMICMATFFATIVKAPLTSIIMICEFTWSFSPLLPVIIGVSIGYIIGDISRTDGIYDELLEVYEKEEKLHTEYKEERFEVCVAEGSLAEKREIAAVLWPANARIVAITRDGKFVVPEGKTVLCAGDLLTIVCKTEDREVSGDDLNHIVGA
ncbi:MAG: chloride channel protein [Clostridia bacterium]|nr:chloride channel protein [Clostridia bacterium]